MTDKPEEKTIEQLAKERPELFDFGDTPPMKWAGLSLDERVKRVQEDETIPEPMRKIILERIQQRRAETGR